MSRLIYFCFTLPPLNKDMSIMKLNNEDGTTRDVSYNQIYWNFPAYRGEMIGFLCGSDPAFIHSIQFDFKSTI